MIDKVLGILKQNKGKYISGEKISDDIGVTRAAVWKHINSLREQGYIIKSSPNKGYILVSSPDILVPYEIKDNLNTSVIGKNIIYHKSVDSTNNVLKRMINTEECKQGTVAIAEQQTEGRGRLGRCWMSPAYKGIWMSILLKPEIKTSEAPFLTLASAVAVAEAIRDITELKATIKWPNDIIINGKKVCGILTEVNGELDMVNYVIIGIGINANVEHDDFPEELIEKATSLKNEKGEDVCRAHIARKVIEGIEINYRKFHVEQGRIDIVDRCKKLSATIGKQIRVNGYNDSYYGEAVDIDYQGRLVVKKEDGSIERLISGEISVRGLDGYV
ncbi:MAG: biotin--[acetyl-CoA-carboxylase] ligase [Clostridia bacterium]|nr:biotin--[acetyl-CoA-carboxylase] ligase [Clostridia bacterium]